MSQLEAPSRHRASTGTLAVPPALRPVLRAYALGYASAVAPRLLTLAVQHILKLRRNADQLLPADPDDEPTFLAGVRHILRSGFDPQRFPTFCAVLVAGTSLLHKPLDKVIASLGSKLSETSRLRLARFLCSFLAGWFGLKLLHTKGTAPRRHSTARRTRQEEELRCKKMAGRTMDLTLFAATRAADVIVGELWSQRRSRRQLANRWTKAESLIQYMADPLVFVSSCALIMWSWFYHPDKLPRGYQKWITSAAQVDTRLIEALRRFHFGALIYGRETGQAGLIGDMCDDYGLPRHWGDPVAQVPLPCEIVHMGCGPSCEYHALSRFARSWKWSMYTYLPLALALQLRRGLPTHRGLLRALRSAARSSAFLALYITFFYYGVCLARTRVGPHFVGTDREARQRLDAGICVGTGCALCGWSVLLETQGRRKDMGLFVAPRALSTLVPRQYPKEKQWRETLTFAASTAVVFTCVLENPRRVRGVLGGVLGYVLRE
ncbi:integral membrane protein [Cordyceps fumosorosea ARSEF 2679]|uniref:Integral membrane protein n=1 Tax=Cordyceps fumosorosea (strain ARSEF 2679) TaxID=1081104 RepID=A0A168BRL9_CORFA|nr:integral membrane protein [Cordyceps fumosorosea ARSEF 2679]OAA70458.1 integral membrane protein [Cordyceps fumosorosea ARSEF 2679]